MMSARNQLLLDLGSHSAKAYLNAQGVQPVGTLVWKLLESPGAQNHIREHLQSLLVPHEGRYSLAIAFGTEAMRRHDTLRVAVERACLELGIHYRTLSQAEEAELIQQAVMTEAGVLEGCDVINAGGGSIQIVSPTNQRTTLLDFGISDLNRRFQLCESPDQRRIGPCLEWIQERLPVDLKPFVYTGGELRYLQHLAVHMEDGRCGRADFERMAEELAGLSLTDLEQRSPHEPRWMHGAVASNCIVLACLRVAAADGFIPSDLNIAHGLVAQVGRKLS